MMVKIDTCDRCGKILSDYSGYHKYSITAFKDDKSDGGFTYCKACYDFMTDLIDKNTANFGEREKRIKDFVDEYNKRFGEDV